MVTLRKASDNLPVPHQDMFRVVTGYEVEPGMVILDGTLDVRHLWVLNVQNYGSGKDIRFLTLCRRDGTTLVTHMTTSTNFIAAVSQ